jgi:hypothetical protein
MGVKVIFFANIQAIDAQTQWYRDELSKYRVMTQAGMTNANGWGMGTLSARMGATAPPIVACDPTFAPLRGIIVEQMRKLAEIGADGVHFDKACMLALDFNPDLPVGPDEGMYQGVIKCIEETAVACRNINPDFCIGVEASWDRLLPHCDAWWNWIDGQDHTAATKYAFSEMLPTFPVVQAYDFTSVNNAIRFGYQLLIGPARWSQSLGDAQYRPLARYVKEVIRIRRSLAETIFNGEFLDTLEVTVKAPPHVKFSVFRNARTGKRACVLMNLSLSPATAVVRFKAGRGESSGRAAIYRPFQKVAHSRLPASVAIPGERLAVVEET